MVTTITKWHRDYVRLINVATVCTISAVVMYFVYVPYMYRDTMQEGYRYTMCTEHFVCLAMLMKISLLWHVCITYITHWLLHAKDRRGGLAYRNTVVQCSISTACAFLTSFKFAHSWKLADLACLWCVERILLGMKHLHPLSNGRKHAQNTFSLRYVLL